MELNKHLLPRLQLQSQLHNNLCNNNLCIKCNLQVVYQDMAISSKYPNILLKGILKLSPTCSSILRLSQEVSPKLSLIQVLNIQDMLLSSLLHIK